MKDYALIIMKPDALERELVDTIIQRFIQDSFKIEMVGYKCVTEDLILNHYQEVIEKLGDWFKALVIKDFVGKGMIPVILSQEGNDAIANARALTGATDPAAAAHGTIRGDLGNDSMEAANRENRSCYNLIHCSDSSESYQNELKLWFSQDIAKVYS
ncbi:nucleoside-diphosphate kinase [Acetobacterium woodii]|uniref:nucleoside-diphosphate kinase n=1 Tax=Acetobacterium woodii (strain ATCC 29683 / DSM 1030 / JCM 2381 / KCTC 1655 / WB1) TaxID=931626 RepID=H6LG06_ACEWD|nr:nucleoside-diphosphate kinase [Acetobacterium woodii]AFA48294.1 nucleoside diphosphate kinase Ndk [Acetobacterium woodii DSM 1030]